MSVVEIFSFLRYVLVQTFGLVIAYAAAAVFIYLILRRLHSRQLTIVLLLVFLGISIFIYAPLGLPHGFEYPFFSKTFGPGQGPVLPFKNVIAFFSNIKNVERVPNIARDPSDIPPPITRTSPATVKIDLTAKEVISEMAPGVFVNYWTFNGTVPGPFLRVREGDTVELTLHNDPSSVNHHSIDLHAVTGPGGGAAATMAAPGESKTITFKALNPGLYVYHCAHENVANHMAHGMYGLILVEPKEGLPKVDREFYVMQGEFYTSGPLGKEGLQIIDGEKMLNADPTYVVFNGRTGALSTANMMANVGEKVRFFVGNGGVNLISSFHLIGEIFDTVYPEASMGGPLEKNVQTTLVPAGGAAIAEVTFNYPGNYTFVDHAIARMDKGAWGQIMVHGEADETIFKGDIVPGHGH